MPKAVGNSDSILLNETFLLKRNGAPTMTSTPLRVPSLERRTPPVAKRGSLSRYSLSELSPTSTSRNSNRTCGSAGPLLASMNIRDNISVYEETKSSGLAQRIVAYKQEAQPEKHVTHQEKYGSPGLFPIVHLFKKKTPEIISPRSNDVVISKKRIQTESPSVDTSPTSSRLKKKFCAYQEFVASKSPKKDDGLSPLVHLFKTKTSELMTPQSNGTTINNSKKRGRADSVSLENSTSPTKKKFCVYEFAASKSSTDYSFLPKKRSLKRKSASTSTEPLSQPKQIRLINAETQTTLPVNEDKDSTPTKADAPKSPARVSEPVIKVFDDKPLDAIRKDRLAALICNMTGKSKIAFQTPKEKPKEEDKGKDIPEQQKETIPVPKAVTQEPVSILSKPKSGSETECSKSDKHVHFNISTESSQVSQQPSLTQTSASIVSPIMSESVSKSTSSSTTLASDKKTLVVPSSNASVIPTLTTTASTTTGSSVTAVSFGDGGSFVGSNSKPSNDPNVSVPITSATAISSAGGGGFKFDLKTPSVPQSSAPSPSFLSSPAIAKSTESNRTTSNTSVTPSFNFSKPDTSKSITNISFGMTTSSTASATTSAPAFSFGTLSKSQATINFGAAPKQVGNVTDSNFGASNAQPSTTVSVPSSLFSDSSKAITPFGGGSFGSSNNAAVKPAPSFGFGGSSTVSITTATATATTSSSLTFGNSGAFKSPTPQSFGTVMNTTASSAPFGSNPAQLSFAGGPSTTTTGMFGSTSATPSSKPLVVFGAAPNSSAPSFGSTSATPSNKPLVVFGGAPTTNPPSFGSITTPSAKPSVGFSATAITSAPSFGSTITAASPPAKPLAIFGAAPTTNAPSFGNASVTTFGTGGSSTGFGTSGAGSGAFKFSTPTATVSAFGTTPQLTFGSTTATPVPAFGSTQATTQAPPAFGSNTATGGTFGALVPVTSANPPPFGSANTSAFGATTNSFKFGSGANKPSSGNPFGSSIEAITTTTNTGTFGAGTGFTSNQGFNGGTSAFGTGGGGSSNFIATGSPMFGTTVTTAAVSAFGQSDSKPTFAFGASQPKTTSVFGSTTGSASFGTTAGNASQGGFGGSGTFGSANNNNAFGNQPQQGTGSFNFNSSASSAPFAFGSATGNAEPPKPSFNFTGGTAGTTGFGSNNAVPSFGGNAPSFATPFGAPAPQPGGVFNIGAGATARPRTLRAKRRT